MNHSSPFTPSSPIDEISRNGWVTDVENNFSPSCTHQTVIGSALSGKTNLLAQFAHHYGENVICYFIDSSPISRTLHHYLFALCSQISELLGKPEPRDGISLDELRSLYSSLSTNLIKHANSTHTKYYYVIDGIEQFRAGIEGSRILDCYPPKLGTGVYLLSSLFEGSREEFSGDNIGQLVQVRRFEVHETEKFLSDLGLNHVQVKTIQSKCQGLPGYLRIIKQAKKTDNQFDVDSVPNELKDLLNKQLQTALKQLTESQIHVLHCSSAVPVALPVKVISAVCEIFNAEIDIPPLIATGLLEYQGIKKYLGISSLIFRETIEAYLKPDKSNLASRLLEKAQQICPEDTSLINSLLHVSGDYEAVKLLLSPDQIVLAVQTSPSAIPDIVARTRIATGIANEQERLADLMTWALMTSVRKSFVSHVSDRPEIPALIALKKYDLAYAKVISIPDEYARILALCQLLADENLNRIPSQQGWLEKLRELLTRLPFDTLDRDSIEQLATAIFPLLPDESDRLLQKLEAVGLIDLFQTESSQEGIETSSKDKSRLMSVLFKRVGYQAAASAGDSWLASLSYEDLLLELSKVTSKGGRLRMLRRWCEVQRIDVNVIEAINAWLNLIVDSSELSIFMGSLRSIAEVLLRRVRLHPVHATAERIEELTKTLLQAPYEEWIKCRMAIVEICSKNDQIIGKQKVYGILKLVDEKPFDLDIQVFCLVRAWLALKRIGVGESDISIVKIREDFQERLNHLLSSSAEHLELLNETIRVLTDIDPEIALITAYELNTRTRRVEAIASILLHLTQGDMGIDVSTSLTAALQSLASIDLSRHDAVLSGMLSQVKLAKTLIHGSIYAVFQSAIERSSSHSQKALMYADLLVIANNSGINTSQYLRATIIEAWDQALHLPQKLGSGYEIVVVLANLNPEFANEFYDRVQSAANTDVGNLAQGSLGVAYQRLIDGAIRLLRRSDLDDSKIALDNFDRLIERLVAPEVQAVVYTKLASHIYNLGLHTVTNDVIRTKILPVIKRINNTIVREHCICFAYPLIHEYDESIAREYLTTVSSLNKQQGFVNAAIWSICHYYLGDPPPDSSRISSRIDPGNIRKSISFLSEIKYDTTFYGVTIAISSAIAQAYENDRIDLQQAVDFLGLIGQAIHNNLPDTQNICHDGYVVLSRLWLIHAKTRIYLYQSRRNITSRLRPADLQSEWEKIIASAQSVPNVADRVFVQAEVAHAMGNLPTQMTGDKQLFRSITKMSLEVINQARSGLLLIPTLLDRCERMITVAEAYASLAKTDELTAILDEVAKQAKKLSGATRDEILASCIQAAFRAGSDSAEKLVQLLDKRRDSKFDTVIDSELFLRKLISNPNHLSAINTDAHNVNDIVGRSIQTYLSDLAGGQIFLHPQKLGLNWLTVAQQCNPDVSFQVVDWAIKVFDQQLRLSGDFSYQLMLRTADLAMKLAQIGTANESRSLEDPMLTGERLRHVHAFAHGDHDRAIEKIASWLRLNAKTYLIICDPYFDLDSIKLLKNIPLECIVTVVTCDNKIKGTAREIEAILKKEWTLTSRLQMPETLLYIVSMSELGSFHDRAFATDNSVLHIGQSLNGLGNQIGSITELYGDLAEEYENEHIERMHSVSFWSKKQIKYTRVQVRP